jgi:hypothetical protein
VQLPERAVVPRPQILDLDRVRDRRGNARRHAYVLDLGRAKRCVRVEQVAQRRRRLLSALERGLEPVEVVGDHRVAGGDVKRREHGLDVLQRHIELAEAADDLRHGELIGAVTPVARIWIDVGGLQNADAMVMAQRLDAQVGGPREVADAQGSAHGLAVCALPLGEGQAATRMTVIL